MCVQDIKIGRNTQAKAYSADLASATPVSFAPGDAARIAVIVNVLKWANDNIVRTASVGVMLDGLFIPLATVSLGSPTLYVRIADVGTLIQQELFWQNQGGDTASLRVATLSLRVPVEQV